MPDASPPPTMLRRLRRLAGLSLRVAVANAPVEVYRRRPHYHYVPDHYGRSAYKDIDIFQLPVFGELARQAVDEGRTLLYFDKLYTVFQAISNLAAAPPGTESVTIADIGTYRGGGAYFMGACAEALGFQRVALQCFDTFRGAQKQDVQPEWEASQEAGRRWGRYRDASPEEIERYLSRFPGAAVHAGRFQDTAAEVSGEVFDLAHVDINLYQPTSFALSFLDKRLSDRGMIVVDDYGSTTNPGVHRAVNEFSQNRPDYVRLHLLTNQCLLLRRPAATREA